MGAVMRRCFRKVPIQELEGNVHSFDTQFSFFIFKPPQSEFLSIRLLGKKAGKDDGG
jgi:hypothetical protein